MMFSSRLQKWKSECVPAASRALAMAAGLAVFTASGSTARATQYTAVDLYALAGGTTYLSSQSAVAGQFVNGSMLWNPDGSAVDLTPAAYPGAEVLGTDGIHQFGGVYIGESGFGPLAGPAVWSGSAASVQPLDRTGLIFARIFGSGGGQFVGTGDTVSDGLDANHALLWNGLAGTPVDLNPTKLGFTSCAASGAGGGQQVGSGYMVNDAYGHTHALLWTGSAESAVDLTPTHLPGNFASQALATDGRQQVGNGVFDVADVGLTHALLWNGTADSAVDLNPAGFEESFATGVSNGTQVGTGVVTGGTDNALLWSGTPDSVVNLQQFLTGAFARSAASSIDEAGDVFGMAYNSSDQQYYAIEWIPQAVPEPASLALFPLAAVALLRRRRARSLAVLRAEIRWLK